MTAIARLSVAGLRNLEQVDLDLGQGFNLIHGVNGSGKTSLLESVYVLSRGKSFRSGQTDTLICNHSDEMVVFARLVDGHQLGLRRGRGDKQSLKLDGTVQSNWDRAAAVAPVLVIDAGTFALLEGGPKARRQYVDWGVFHVEPAFITAWRRFRKALAHRNQLLKQQAPSPEELEAWDREFSSAGEAVHIARYEYVNLILPIFQQVYSEIAGSRALELSIDYAKGWSDHSLAVALRSSRRQDLRYKATQVGPQRADLTINVGSRSAVDVLSRGQQKVLICALKIAQGLLYSEGRGRQCIYLIDDLPAELDKSNRKEVLACIARMNCQCLVTCVDRSDLEDCLEEAKEVVSFHVERGKIGPLN